MAARPAACRLVLLRATKSCFLSSEQRPGRLRIWPSRTLEQLDGCGLDEGVTVKMHSSTTPSDPADGEEEEPARRHGFRAIQPI